MLAFLLHEGGAFLQVLARQKSQPRALVCPLRGCAPFGSLSPSAWFVSNPPETCFPLLPLQKSGLTDGFIARLPLSSGNPAEEGKAQVKHSSLPPPRLRDLQRTDAPIHIARNLPPPHPRPVLNGALLDEEHAPQRLQWQRSTKKLQTHPAQLQRSAKCKGRGG